MRRRVILPVKKFRSNCFGTDEYKNILTEFKKFQSTLKKLIYDVKKNYYLRKFHIHKSNMKNMWTVIKETMNDRRKRSKIQTFFMRDSIKVDDPVEICNAFNDFFTSIGPKLARDIKKIHDRKLEDSFSCRNNNRISFNFTRVTCLEIKNINKSLAPKTSCGHDEISCKLLKKISPTILYPFQF